MKKLLIILLFLFSLPTSSQNQRRCGFLEANEYLFKQDNTARERFESRLAEKETQLKTYAVSSAPLYTIPVVFHVLHQGGVENISDAQIMDALFILNRDFNKQNADTSNIVSTFQAIAANCNVRFELATLDEQGNCTNGITRHYDVNADWNMNLANFAYTWDRTKYLNIYVVKSLPPGIAGYTYLPGTVSAMIDAIVILHSYTGGIGTGSSGASRSLTHEVGHWLNLQHVWGSGNQPGISCGDDGVGDTPVTKGFGFCDLTNADQCTVGVDENIQNYMEYAFCQVMFTVGQRNRMHNMLNSAVAGRSNLSSPNNLIDTGVLSGSVACAPKAEYKPNHSVTCVGSPLGFSDFSYNGTVTQWEWSSPTAPISSTSQQGILNFNATGSATVKLKVSNSAGSDSITKQSVLVMAPVGTGSINVTQSFENSPFPDNDWIRTMPQFGSPFQTTTVSAKSGSTGIWVNNFYDNPNESVSFYTPAFFYGWFAPASLSFQYAYAQKSTGNDDMLKIYATNDCGQNWSLIYSASGNSLATTANLLSTPYYPSSNEFSLVTIPLNEFAENPLHLKFEFSPDLFDPGNNLFIDDVNINGLVPINELTENSSKIKVYPNPFIKSFTLSGITSSENIAFQLLDMYGRQLPVEVIESRPDSLLLQLVSEISNGIYFLEVKERNTKRVLKIIKD